MQTRVFNPYANYGNDQMRKAASTSTASLLRGTVISNNDPLNLGRLKVRVPSVHSGMPDEDLPWCMPNSSSASYKSGQFIIPEENNTVWVAFEDGDPYRPVWLGCAYSAKTTRSKQIGNTNGQKRARVVGETESPSEGWSLEQKILYKSPSGSVIYMDETTNGDSIVLKDNGGTTVVVGSGYINLITAEGIQFEISDDDDEVSMGVGGTLIKLACRDEEITIKNNKASIKIDKEGVHTEYKNTSFDVKESSIEGEVDSTKMKIGKGEFLIDTGNTKIESKDKVKITTKSGSIDLGDGIANINADTVNINASYVNIPRE